MSDSSAGIFGGMTFLINVAIMVLFIIAYWKIFEKAGKAGWASLIPFYNLYVMCEITWPKGALLPFILFFVPIANMMKQMQLMAQGVRE